MKKNSSTMSGYSRTTVNASIIVVFLMLGFFASAPSLFAQSSSDSASNATASLANLLAPIGCLDDSVKTRILDNPEEVECSELIETCFSTQRADTLPKITEHFQANAPNSVLLPEVIALVRALKREASDVFDIMTYVHRSGKVLTTKPSELDDCRKAKSELYDDVLKKVVKEYAMKTASAKRDYILVQKYKEINAQLLVLNDLMGKWYGYMGAAAQKIPGTSKYCQ